jgi:HK97 family phage major capsid protein
MNLRQLQQAKAAAVDAAKAIQTTATGRLLTTEEQASFEGHLATAEARETDIQGALRLQSLERSAPPLIGSIENLAEKKPWQNKADFLGAVIASTQAGRVSDPRLQAALGGSESVPAEGGFPVPTEFAADLLQRAYDVGDVARQCRRIEMSSSRLIMNAIDESSRVDGGRWGGLLAFWASEAAAYTSTKPKFRELQFTANKLTGLAYLTEELMEDTTAVSSYIDTIFPDEFAFKIDDAIINGLGQGMPLGILQKKSAATIVVPKDAGQATGTVSSSNILNMWSRLWAKSRKNACWFINQSIETQLYPLLIAGTAGTSTATLMYVAPGQYGNNSDYGLLMGKPVIPIEQTSALSAQGDIILADMSQYILAQRSEVRADSSIHVAFLTGELALRFQVRLDGQSWWNTPLTPKAAGAPTLSPFVTLASR